MGRAQSPPAGLAALARLSGSTAATRAAAPAAPCAARQRQLEELAGLYERIDAAQSRLEAHLAEAERLGNGQQAACYYRDEVLPDMAAVREAADKAEALLPADALPYPDYSALLFSV